ncbi:hypothetical protein [Methanosarcina sp. MTP4]|uniref:hypothetical protein n=1 Tax=Methanosarcina sp. MTP4 TaxID=1434100 RepID=UPI000A55AFC0|nr:hypothetical protein [Methanosarcina sp. MTP4]
MEIYKKARVGPDKALSEAFPAGITPDDYSDAMTLASFHGQQFFSPFLRLFIIFWVFD